MRGTGHFAARWRIRLGADSGLTTGKSAIRKRGLDMAGVNKNSSRGSGSRPGFKQHQFSPEVRLVQSLNSGKNARVADPVGGRSVLCSTDSPEFLEALRALGEAGMADRVQAELQHLADTYPALGWGTIRARAASEGVLAAAD